MGLELVDVEELKAMGIEHLARSQQREIGEVLVVDRVELVALDEAQQVGNLDRRHPWGASTSAIPPTKSLRSGTWAMTLLAASRSAARPSAASRSSQIPSEELDDGLDALLLGHLRDIGGRLDTQRGDPALDEVLQQIAVVAGELNDEAVVIEAETLAPPSRRTCGRAPPTSPSTRRSTHTR